MVPSIRRDPLPGSWGVTVMPASLSVFLKRGRSGSIQPASPPRAGPAVPSLQPRSGADGLGRRSNTTLAPLFAKAMKKPENQVDSAGHLVFNWYHTWKS
jgi:hypothetical protein